MSYRTFKHLLGETSLERKCRFIFGGGLFVLVSISFSWYGHKTESLVAGQTLGNARRLVPEMLSSSTPRTRRPSTRRSPSSSRRSTSRSSGRTTWRTTKGKVINLAESGSDKLDPFEREALGKFLKATPPRANVAPAGPPEEAVHLPRRHPDGGEPGRRGAEGIPVHPGRAVQQVCIDCHAHKFREASNGQLVQDRENELACFVTIQHPDGPDEPRHPQQPRHPDQLRAGDGPGGDVRLVRDRPLRDRQAGEAPARRLRRDRRGQADDPQPDPDRATSSKTSRTPSTGCSTTSSPCSTSCATSTTTSTRRSTSWPRPTWPSSR